MPNRVLRSDILSSYPVNSLSESAEIFYRRLISVADDHGRYVADPKLLRPAMYPLQLEKISEKHIERCVKECIQADLIQIYMHDAKHYLLIHKFGQRVQSHSKFPDPPVGNGSSPDSTVDHGDSPWITVDHGESPFRARTLGVGVGDVVEDEGVKSNLSPAAQPDKPAKKSKPHFPARPETIEECIAFVMDKLQLPKTDGVWLWDHWMGNGFRVNGKPMASWKHTASNWKAQRYFPSLKDLKR